MIDDFLEKMAVIVEKAEEEYADDIDAGMEYAFPHISKLEGYDEYLEILAKRAIRSAIGDRRHEHNQEIFRASGLYGRPAKVVQTGAAEIATIAQRSMDYMDYRIGGRRLGSIRGNELVGLANTAFAAGRTHVFRGRLCMALSKKVKGEKEVEQVLTRKQVNAVANRMLMQLEGEVFE